MLRTNLEKYDEILAYYSWTWRIPCGSLLPCAKGWRGIQGSWSRVL